MANGLAQVDQVEEEQLVGLDDTVGAMEEREKMEQADKAVQLELFKNQMVHYMLAEAEVVHLGVILQVQVVQVPQDGAELLFAMLGDEC